MRADSPNLCFTRGIRLQLSPAPNSLFCNILQIKPLDSIFCGDAHRYLPGNPLRMNILENTPITSAEIDTQTDLQADAKSLFRNILPVSRCDSRFCRSICRSAHSKSLGMNTLAGSREKIVRGYTETPPVRAPSLGANSLFRNILPVSPCGSRFCPDMSRYPPSKSFRMNILDGTQKNVGGGPTRRRNAPKSLY